MISKEMLELLFRPASMQRWNDHIRPHTGFSELDKQAHKMVCLLYTSDAADE